MLNKSFFFVLFISFFLFSCSKSENPADKLAPSESKPVGNRVYGPIEPIVLDLPDGVIKTLAGTDSESQPLKKVYVYFKTMNVVVYRDSFDAKNYIVSISDALAQLSQSDAFTKAADSWAIQMQKKGTSELVVIAVNPAQAKEFAASRQIEKFLSDADYLMINDKIIPPAERLNYYLGKIPAPSPTGFSSDKKTQ